MQILLALVLLLALATVARYVFRLITLCAASRIQFGSTLNDFVERVRKQPSEHLALFSANGKKILGISDYDRDEVRIDWLAMKYCRLRHCTTAAHNHPGTDCTFSLADLLLSQKLNLQEHIVVAGKYKYYLAPRNGWGSREEIARAFSRQLSQMEVLTITIRQRPDGTTFSAPESLQNTHEAMSTIAKELNYEYRREML